MLHSQHDHQAANAYQDYNSARHNVSKSILADEIILVGSTIELEWIELRMSLS